MTSTNSAPTTGRWPLWGAAAGVLGIIGTLISDTRPPEELSPLGPESLAEVQRGMFHVGIVAGLAATLCVLVTAAGWRRFASVRPAMGASLAVRVIPLALTASAGAMILGYGMKGSLAVYLPGGMDEGSYTNEALFSVFVFLDFAPYVAWWGVCFAAMAVTWLALREKLLARWLGWVSVPFALAPVIFMGATGLPGFPGVVDGVWLVIVSLGLAFSRRGGAAAA